MLQEEIKEAEVKTTDKKEKKRFPKKLALLVVAGLLLLIAAVAVGLWYQNKDVVARVGSDFLTKKDLNRAIYAIDFKGSIDNPTKVNADREKEIVNEMVDNLLVKKQAEANGVSVSDKELNAVIKERGMESSDYTAEQKSLAREDIKMELLRQKFESTQFAWKEGEYVLFRFDKFGESSTFPGKTTDLAKYAEQKTHAKQLADTSFAQLKAGTADINSIVSVAAQDATLGVNALEPYRPNISGKFSKEAFNQPDGYFNTELYPDLKNYISGLKKGVVNEPYLLQIKWNGKNVEIAYALIKVTNENNGKYSGTLKSWLEAQKKDKKVRIYAAKAPFYKKVTFIPKAYAVDCSNDASGSKLDGDSATDLRMYLKYVTSSGAVKDITPSMKMSFDFKSVQLTLSGYDQSQHSFVKAGSGEQPTYRNICNVPQIVDGTVTIRTSSGTLYKINCGYVYNINVYFNNPKITDDSGNGTWKVKDVADGGQSDSQWVDFSQNVNDGQMRIRTFCWLHTNGKCNSDSSHYKSDAKDEPHRHFPNGDKIDLTMIYTPSWVKPSCSLTASPTSVQTGGTSTLTWSTTNATSFSIGGIAKALNNSIGESTGALNENTTFTGTVSGSGGSNTCSATVTTTTPPPVVTPSCSVSPQSGLAPLVVKVEVLNGTTPYTFTMGDGTTLSNRQSSILYYTYSTPGQYRIKATTAGKTVDCLVSPVTVTAPNSGGGGEVSP